MKNSQKLTNLEHRHTWNFAPARNFQIQPGLTKIDAAREFQLGAKRMFFYFISPWGENIYAYLKITYKISCKMFNFKTFKIVTASLLNLYSCYIRFMIKEDN